MKCIERDILRDACVGKTNNKGPRRALGATVANKLCRLIVFQCIAV